ncbi:MAG: LCP family protein [Leptolyngbyaceae cyanobacterium]
MTTTDRKQRDQQAHAAANPNSSLEESTPPQTFSSVPLTPATMPAVPFPSLRLLTRLAWFSSITVASAALGLMTAFLVPLPIKSAVKPSTHNFWQMGLQYRVGRPINILVMGIDQVPGAAQGSQEVFAGRSDTMLLLRVNPEDDSVHILSIPRDTQINLEGVGITKINDANARGGASLAARSVSGVLNQVEIDRYIRISTGAFRELVDLLGGVEVYVPAPMHYIDNTQKLNINLEPGLQRLNGDQAEQFARFRHDEKGDIGRVQRQQMLLKALLKQATNPLTIPRLPLLVSGMQKYIDTNLTPEEMLALVETGRKLSQGNFKMVMLPGRFSEPNEFIASYWIMNIQGRDRVMQQYFDVEPIGLTEEPSLQLNSFRIAVQNASNHPNAAFEMQEYLAQRGFTNVFLTTDWPDHQAKTQIIVQRGDIQGAESLQQALHLGIVTEDSTGDLDSDLTIRLGNDWTIPHHSK